MISNFFLIISWVFLIFGVIGLFRFQSIYLKILVASKIDTVAFFSIILALVFRIGLQWETLKLLVILLFFLITNPLNSQFIGRSALINGIPLKAKENPSTDYRAEKES
ncbi:cation:proton antiporter [Isachenkonia alkalipeptolytica]|uniref:Monovalent cation/H(+) antiporter subunit G n=1 Tax=Isachenkonia alkalipeptolytica TaxID=2565777 RepID=A0AA43XJJ2_9CLOT|nr:monovalent cation/H(+) antiporter subunit G [Isachenkonia alkalipeptolytica]NBG87727.1 monovalent cation/H(+) antiporter subunit G [Isachenkonia alkalipeptolytica]